MSEDKRQF